MTLVVYIQSNGIIKYTLPNYIKILLKNKLIGNYKNLKWEQD